MFAHIMGTCTVITNLHRSIFLLYFSFPSNPTLHTVCCFRTTSRHTRKCRGSTWGNSNKKYRSVKLLAFQKQILQRRSKWKLRKRMPHSLLQFLVSRIWNILDMQECLHIMSMCTVMRKIQRSIFLLYSPFPSNPTLHTVYYFRTTNRHTGKCRGSTWGNSNRSY